MTKTIIEIINLKLSVSSKILLVWFKIALNHSIIAKKYIISLTNSSAPILKILLSIKHNTFFNDYKICHIYYRQTL